MSMIEWAKKEIDIACKKENPNIKIGEDGMSIKWEYGCSCYRSAFKAYLSLMEDGHSGVSFYFTCQILNRLMEGLPLTPIEDIPENWKLISDNKYQCKRMSSLFKDVDDKGNIRYFDINRYYCKDIKTSDTFTYGKASKYLDDHYPITMPYYTSTRKIIINCEELDDDIKMISILFPDGEKVEVETEDN